MLSVSLNVRGKARTLLDQSARQRLRRRAKRILAASGLADAEWSVVLTDDAEQASLNQRFRGKTGTTDVLSFPLDDPLCAELIGDVVISVEQASRQASIDIDLETEIVRLLVHGFCHLCGHDHQDAAEAKEMRAQEELLLTAVLGEGAATSMVLG